MAEHEVQTLIQINEVPTAISPMYAPRVAGGRASTVARFGLHFLEMLVAMMAGMMVLGGVFRGLLAAAGMDYDAESERLPELFALVMAVNMAAGMADWMRYRGHRRRAIVEMSGAMVVPVLAILPLFWLGTIGSDALIGLEHALMLPAMLAVMLYRHGEYTQRYGRKGGHHVPASRETYPS